MPTSVVPPARDLPSWVLVLVPAAGWLLMAAIDTMLWIDENPPSPGLHSVFLCAVVTLTILAHRVHDRQQRVHRERLVVDRVCQHITREQTNLYRIFCKANDTPTEPILRVVGTAAVVPTPPPPPAQMDPRVVEIGERIARRLTDN